MKKIKMQGKIYKVSKKDTLTPSDENKLVDLSHSEVLYVTKLYGISDEGDWWEKITKEESQFISTLPKEFEKEFDLIHSLESKIIDED